MESIGKEISIIDNDLLEKNIKIVMSQTTYSYDKSKQFLSEFPPDNILFIPTKAIEILADIFSLFFKIKGQ